MCLEEEHLRPEPDGNEQDARHPVQKLYEICKSTLTPFGSHLSIPALQTLRLLLESIKPVDVGLDDLSQGDRGFGFSGLSRSRRGRHLPMISQQAPPVHYIHIYDCQEFSMGIFCLPTSAVIPLHNHPGMTVFSKLLYGSMHVKAYDWVDASDLGQPRRLAKLVVDRTMSAPCQSTVLYPTSGGNMHSFTALTSCAVLDILAPPYSPEDGRHCTYYRDFPYSSAASTLESWRTDEDNIKFAWLEECQPSDDFILEGAPYRGLQIAP